mmetsp:Transcript_7104/g.15647  ORF Transcript_7104/g.15647 Transcript_7104/m.15647 type:complete len:113 (+) Transcript_7104:1204-1542(+)
MRENTEAFVVLSSHIRGRASRAASARECTRAHATAHAHCHSSHAGSSASDMRAQRAQRHTGARQIRRLRARIHAQPPAKDSCSVGCSAQSLCKSRQAMIVGRRASSQQEEVK